jgi:hypothetical protein
MSASSNSPPLEMVKLPHVKHYSIEFGKSVPNHDGFVIIEDQCIPHFENGVNNMVGPQRRKT